MAKQDETDVTETDVTETDVAESDLDFAEPVAVKKDDDKVETTKESTPLRLVRFFLMTVAIAVVAFCLS